MKFGYILPNYGDRIKAEELLDISAVCEEVGFDSVWATDHVVMPLELREPYGELLEPLTTLGFVAGRCPRLRVGTSILVLPQRNPVLVAKQVAALDVFSGGRVVLGVGAGWVEKEFGFLNSDFARRGRVLDESIVLMRALWKEEVVDFDGEFFHMKQALFLPKPVNGTVPVWVGGNGLAAQRRASTLGDGWHPTGLAPEGVEEGVRRVRSKGREVVISARVTVDVRKKREPVVLPGGEKRVAVSGSPAEVRAGVDAYARAGVEHFCASMNHPAASEIIADIRRFAADVVSSY